MNHNTVPAGGGHHVGGNAPVERFEFPVTGQAVRTAELRGAPAVVANDVCAVLQHSNPRQAVANLPEHMKGVTEVDTPGGAQRMTVLTEAGVYRLVMRSNLPAAVAFQDWLAETVLPAIRKTGSYSVTHQTPQSFAEALELAAAQQRVIEARDAQIAIAAPKVAIADQFLESVDTIYLTDLAKNFKITRHRLISVLRDEGVLFLDELTYRAGYEDWFEAVMDWVDRLGQYKPALKVTRLGVQKIYELLVDGEHINPDRRTPPARPSDNRP